MKKKQGFNRNSKKMNMYLYIYIQINAFCNPHILHIAYIVASRDIKTIRDYSTVGLHLLFSFLCYYIIAIIMMSLNFTPIDLKLSI